MFDDEDEKEFCAGVSKPALIYNPDKLYKKSVMKELRQNRYVYLSKVKSKYLDIKEKENL